MTTRHDAIQGLWASVLGEERRQTSDFAEVLEAARQGADPLVEVPWYPDGRTHQIVLRAVEGDRVRFYNPLGHQGSLAGEVLMEGPHRRVEADGLESMPVAQLLALFGRGGWALVPR